MSGAALVAFMVAVGMIAQQLAGKAVRDAFFLTHFDAQSLPQAMTVASLLSVGMVLATSFLYRRFEPQRVVPSVFVLSALVFVGVWGLSDLAPRPAAAVLYLHTSSVGAVAISGFWSVVNETFDPHTLKRSVGRIASGASAGGVLGGLLTWQGSAFVSIELMLIALALINLTCAVGVMSLGRGRSREGPAERRPSQPLSATEVFEQTPYLRHVLGLVVLLAVAAAFYDYAFKAEAARAMKDSEALVGFFAAFYSGVGVLTFLVQAGLSSWVLRRAGLTVSVASLPLSILGFGLFALLEGSLWAFTLLRGAAAVAESSLYRSGYELLFTPLTPEKKRPTKSLIDVGGDKLGVAIGSATGLFVVGLAAGAAQGLLLAGAMVCSAFALVYVRRLYRGYLAALTDSLERGAVRADDLDIADPGTARAVERTMALPREAALPALDPAKPRAQPGSSTEDRGAWEASTEWSPPEAVLRWFEASRSDLLAHAALESGDSRAQRRALQRHAPLPSHLVAPAIRLLERPAHAPSATRALEAVAAAHVGQLGDALLDLTRPMAARAQVTAILAKSPGPRATEVLVHGARSRPLEIRLRCAFALAEHGRMRPGVIPSEFAHERIRAELDRYPPRASTPSRRHQVLALCVQLLTLTGPREPLLLAARAVAKGGGGASGTGREYLDNVVPEDVLRSLLLLLSTPDALRSLDAASPEAVLREEAPVDSLGRLKDRLRAWHPDWSRAPT